MAQIWQRIRKNPDCPYLPLPDYGQVLLGKLAPRLAQCRTDAVWNRRVDRARRGYAQTLARIRAKAQGGARIRVLFIVQSTSKWKCQALYDALKADARFEVRVGVSRSAGMYAPCTPREIAQQMEQTRAFFAARGCATVDVYDPRTNVYADLAPLGCDLVFLPESWYQPKRHRPDRLAAQALCYYIPYYAQDYGSLETNCLLPIFRLYYRYIIQNEEWASIFKTELAKAGRSRAGDIVGLGHPMLDLIPFRPDPPSAAQRLKVVYAPHWTVAVPGVEERFSFATFRENGREILAYARQHPEIDWVFRPHPNLKSQLLKCDFMTHDEVEAYYEAWRQIGTYSTGGGYETLFQEADALVTDCGSFLTEFGATGRPVIHLLSARNTLVALPPSKRVFDTYYQVRDLKGLYETFATVLERREDPLRTRRLAALAAGRLVGNNAAQAIHKALVEEFYGA